jgi:hypothetical protein
MIERDSILGNYGQWLHTLDYDLLNVPANDIVDLDHCFSVDEVVWLEKVWN